LIWIKEHTGRGLQDRHPQNITRTAEDMAHIILALAAFIAMAGITLSLAFI
jgi:hypothetical protein